MKNNPLVSGHSRTRIESWELLLQNIPGCIDVLHSDLDSDVQRICKIFEESDALIGMGESAAYMEGENFVAVAVHIETKWLFARYERRVEIGQVHARVEEKLSQERVGTQR